MFTVEQVSRPSTLPFSEAIRYGKGKVLVSDSKDYWMVIIDNEGSFNLFNLSHYRMYCDGDKDQKFTTVSGVASLVLRIELP